MNGEKIKNYTIYNEKMKKSLLDKIFFMDKIEATLIVDYGCADGTLIHFLSSLFPETYYIGYDIDENMLKKALEKFSEEDNVFFTSNWEEVENAAMNDKNTAVILSSVIHEVYTYGTQNEVNDLWENIFARWFQYVIIRDMIPGFSIDKESNINDVKNVLRKGKAWQIRDFEQIWGSIEQNKNLIHFLLKYDYIDNWEREVRENYFPILREEMLKKIPDEYDIEFSEHFILPFLRNKIRKDFGIELKDNTHLKLILRRK
ncbi:MAG: class I SAM-dependent methyltransferase [Promethearchaeota archaeon]